jgi:hypothetical protein
MEEKTNNIKGLSQIEFEEQRRKLSIDILKQAHSFIAWDLEFNKHISDLAEELVKQLKANPRIMSSGIDIKNIINEMRAEKDKGLSDKTGGDIIGGDIWEYIWSIIKDILTGEKDFIKDIIKWVIGM